MIGNAILQLVSNFIEALLDWLPDVSLSSIIYDAIINANSYISAFDLSFPVSTFLTIFSIILTIEISIGIYKLVMWVIKKIPTIN